MELTILFWMIGNRKLVELEHLLNCLPSHSSAKDSAESQLNPGTVCSLPTLVDPRYVPLLSKLIRKSVGLGCHKQFVKIYRCKLLHVSNCLTYLPCIVTVFHDLRAHDIFLHSETLAVQLWS